LLMEDDELPIFVRQLEYLLTEYQCCDDYEKKKMIIDDIYLISKTIEKK
jgi:hypothetical protein